MVGIEGLVEAELGLQDDRLLLHSLRAGRCLQGSIPRQLLSQAWRCVTLVWFAAMGRLRIRVKLGVQLGENLQLLVLATR